MHAAAFSSLTSGSSDVEFALDPAVVSVVDPLQRASNVTIKHNAKMRNDAMFNLFIDLDYYVRGSASNIIIA
jgi:hypothetical protein